MIQDLTVGKPLRLILKFAFPLLLGNMLQNIYHISDILIVGRLIGTDALAAVGSSAPIFFVLLMTVFGFTNGLTIVTAQYFGAKADKNVRRSATHSIMASTVLSIICTAIMLFILKDILHIMNVPQEIFKQSYNFMFCLCCGLLMMVYYNLFSNFIRALGDSKTPLYFLFFSTSLNIGLNFLFIRYYKMGVVGSALGTIIAISISAVLCFIYMEKKYPLLRPQSEDWRFDWDFMKHHLSIAFPMSLQFSIIGLSLMVIQSVCNSFGANTIAAFTAAMRLEQLATQPVIALGLAIATYTAQNYGAGKITRIRRGVYKCSLITLIFSILMAFVIRYIGEDMIGVFIKNGNSEIITIGCNYLNITTIFYFFLGQIFIYRNALQGMGSSDIPVYAGIMELAMRSFAAIYLAKHIGYIGICYAGPIAWIGASLTVGIGYHVLIKKLHCKFLNGEIHYLSNHRPHPMAHGISAE